MANFSEEIIRAVWQKGTTVSENDPGVYRKDVCGAWIRWNHYGNRDSKYGWEIDHIKAVANGGSDSILNLRPLQWENNARKSDGSLVCPVTATNQ